VPEQPVSPGLIGNRFIDPAHWSKVRPRPDDIVIATCYKAGTTLTQQIVRVLSTGADPDRPMRELSPWIDSGLFSPDAEAVEAMPSRRVFKSHLPFDALPHPPGWRYVYLVREARDVCYSLYKHCRRLRDEIAAMKVDRPEFDHGAEDFPTFFDDWLASGRPRWPFFENVASWWAARARPDVLLLHFTDLVDDKRTVVRRIADFLDIEASPQRIDLAVEKSEIAHMKALERIGLFGSSARKRVARFVDRGTHGQWAGRIGPERTSRLLRALDERLPKACARWVQQGGSILDGDG